MLTTMLARPRKRSVTNSRPWALLAAITVLLTACGRGGAPSSSASSLLGQGKPTIVLGDKSSGEQAVRTGATGKGIYPRPQAHHRMLVTSLSKTRQVIAVMSFAQEKNLATIAGLSRLGP